MNDKRTVQVLKAVQKTKRLLLLPYAYSLRWCNNNCKFCYLKPARLTKIPNKENFVKLGETQVTWLKDNLSFLPENTVVECHIIGGEIGALPNDYLEYLHCFINELNDVVTDTTIVLQFILLTNLILPEQQFQNIKDLYDHVTELNKIASISTSFDFTGRFQNEQHFRMWKNNTLSLIEDNYRVTIETILTKSAIESYLNENETEIAQTFESLLELDACGKTSVIMNEYQPYDSHSMNEIPTFEETNRFYVKMAEKYGKDINALKIYDLSKEFCSPFSCEYVAVMSALSNDVFLNSKNGILQNKPCELLTHTFWPKNDPVESKQISKNQPTEEFICTEHPEKVEFFFNNVYGCGTCKYYNECKRRNLRGCYQNHQFVWKDNKCIHKKLFEMVNDE